MTPVYAQIVPIGTPVDREMTYRVPEDLHDRIQPGSLDLFPMGPRWTTGIALSFQEHTDLDKVKSVGILLDDSPIISPSLLTLCRWMADYYLCTLAEVFKAALPSGINTASGQYFAPAETNGATEGVLTPRQREVLDNLRQTGSATLSQLERRLGRTNMRSAVYALVQRGLLTTCQKMKDPRVKSLQERVVELVPEDARWMESELPELERRAPRQGECIRRLWQAGGKLPAQELTGTGISSSILKALEERRLVRFTYKEIRRDPYADLETAPPEALEPTPHQKTALEHFEKHATQFGAHLLHGITGSGKTLVYIRCVARALERGKGSLVLVPEISLTPQTVRAFRAHFGNNVAVLHSALSEGERYDAWREVREGRRSIVIGARSAIFAPIQNLGLIVIDEEHDSSYKQADPAPRYNARDVAVMRAKLENIPVILGSATPALESFLNANTGKFQLVSLPERIDARPLPEVTLVDMKKEGGGLFSRPLREKIKDRLGKGERIILLQNRRGYAPYVQCTDCGEALECPNCQVTLTYHAKDRRLLCHYCSRNVPAPTRCEACNGEHLELLGVGTQRVEETLEKQFPEARVLRFDVDTTRKKGSHDRILEAFRKGEADILLGTQMVAKGLDFPGVTLVGVISADTSIHLPDFRASERTFQLLTQVSGRAGRGTTPGEVVVQTYLPDGQAVRCAQQHDFLTFAHVELEDRQAVGYPPFGRMALLLFKGPNELEVARAAGLCAEAARSEAVPGVDVMGPVQAPLGRIRNTYRWQVILKAQSARPINLLARDARTHFGGKRRSGISLDIDIDPVSLL
ncbi:MAG: primosomal protein N' [bacterium]|nr:primosomal protein N' [bacterium]